MARPDDLDDFTSNIDFSALETRLMLGMAGNLTTGEEGIIAVDTAYRSIETSSERRRRHAANAYEGMSNPLVEDSEIPEPTPYARAAIQTYRDTQQPSAALYRESQMRRDALAAENIRRRTDETISILRGMHYVGEESHMGEIREARLRGVRLRGASIESASIDSARIPNLNVDHARTVDQAGFSTITGRIRSNHINISNVPQYAARTVSIEDLYVAPIYPTGCPKDSLVDPAGMDYYRRGDVKRSAVLCQTYIGL